jgi:hypothetical protein
MGRQGGGEEAAEEALDLVEEALELAEGEEAEIEEVMTSGDAEITIGEED